MIERIVLRSLLYFVFGYSALAALLHSGRETGFAAPFGIAAVIALGCLAVSARRVETPRPPEGKAGAGVDSRGWLTRRD